MRPMSLETLVQALRKGAAAPPGTVQSTLQALKVMAVSGVREHFQKQQAPDGTPWQPLKRPRPDGSDVPLRDQGLLAASISASVTERELIVQASHPGAAVHQFGAEIRPKGKYLAIPQTKEAKRIGSARLFPRSLFFVACKSATGNGLLCERGQGGKLIIQYFLTKGVNVPARPYLGFSEKTLNKMQRLLADVFTGVVLKPIAGTDVGVS